MNAKRVHPIAVTASFIVGGYGAITGNQDYILTGIFLFVFLIYVEIIRK